MARKHIVAIGIALILCMALFIIMSYEWYAVQENAIEAKDGGVSEMPQSRKQGASSDTSISIGIGDIEKVVPEVWMTGTEMVDDQMAHEYRYTSYGRITSSAYISEEDKTAIAYLEEFDKAMKQVETLSVTTKEWGNGSQQKMQSKMSYKRPGKVRWEAADGRCAVTDGLVTVGTDGEARANQEYDFFLHLLLKCPVRAIESVEHGSQQLEHVTFDEQGHWTTEVDYLDASVVHAGRKSYLFEKGTGQLRQIIGRRGKLDEYRIAMQDYKTVEYIERETGEKRAIELPTVIYANFVNGARVLYVCGEYRVNTELAKRQFSVSHGMPAVNLDDLLLSP